MTPGARLQAVIELLEQAWSGRQPIDQLADVFFKKRRYAGSSDRRGIQETLYQILRHQARLDWWIDRSGQPVSASVRARIIANLALADKTSPDAIAALFTGSNHCPAPLSQTELELADSLYGRPLTHADMPRPVALEYPDWMDASLSALWGDRLEAEISALNQLAPVDLRVNTLKSTPEQAKAELASQFIETETTPLSPLGLRLIGKARLGGTQAFRDGLVEVQDEGSQLLALLCGAEPGMTVIDYCAGAGGKTLALAAAMAVEGRIRGRIYACDISQARINRMQPRLQRAGALAVRRQILSGRNDAWVKANRATADRVLVDVPCTGTGAWRRDPQAKWRFTPEQLDDIRIRQQAILEDAATLVKPGGRLIYATCSLLQEENEQQLFAFLKDHEAFAPLAIDQVWSQTVGGPPPPAGPCLRLSPASTGTDGFFCAVLERRS
ncbi:MAG: RsmB/NOP family class I SAM-dependent RNA methyltransferase [Rhodospirillales bacterium]|nr:RsmB/NOP family class I SAM-dependent RNA methyltransferase [Rhodospirillales bacterium]